MEKCPYCSANIRNASECYCCGFDFTLLKKCEAEAERYFQKALISLKAGLIAIANDSCLKSLQFENRDRTRRLKHHLSLMESFLGPKKG
jgi:hypothetical protein